MYRKTALLLFLTGLLFSAFSQEELIRKFDIQSNNRIDVSGKVTAIVFKTDQFLGTTVELTINGEIEEIPFDADGPEFTYYKSLDGAKELTSFSSDYEGSLHLIYSGITPKINRMSVILLQLLFLKVNGEPDFRSLLIQEALRMWNM